MKNIHNHELKRTKISQDLIGTIKAIAEDNNVRMDEFCGIITRRFDVIEERLEKLEAKVEYLQLSVEKALGFL